MLISNAIEGYLLFKAERASATTLKTDRVLLRQFTEWLGDDVHAHTVTTDHIRDYLAHHRSRGLSPYTLHRHRAILSALWSWLAKPPNNLVDSNVVSDTQAPKLPKRKKNILSKEEVAALLKAAGAGHNPRRDEAILRFLLDSCARASELTALQTDDLDLKTGRALVVGKGDKQRFVWIGNRSSHAVWLYINTERPQSPVVREDPLFRTLEGYSLDRQSLRLIITRLGKRADVPRVHPHLLRHTGAVWRLLNGMNLESLREFLGHEDLTVTRRYLSGMTDADLGEIEARTSVIDNWRL